VAGGELNCEGRNWRSKAGDARGWDDGISRNPEYFFWHQVRVRVHSRGNDWNNKRGCVRDIQERVKDCYAGGGRGRDSIHVEG